jgi:deoxyribodipyrimidine photolyase
VTVLAGSGTASFGANATVSATVTRAWDADATVEAKFNVVRREIADLRQELEEDKSQLAAWRSDLAQRIDAVDSKLRDATSALIRRLDKEAHEAARIDARGLPLIGLGIVLAGVPDGLADHWDGDVGWALIGVAALLTAAAVRSARRSRTLRH